MTDKKTFMQKFDDFQPSKALWAWTTVGAVVGTVLIGFIWGGWVTGNTAKTMAYDAGRDSRATLASNMCIDNFLAGPDAAGQLAALKKESSWSRDSMIEKAGWTTFPGDSKPVPGAADLCAEHLVTVELPADMPGKTSESSGTMTDGAMKPAATIPN
ncbi:hypothetical protein [Oceanibaculum nanhaiense]|uniref:hypothetical protein n=1 Tax=Oceanibaculum nanhaiense TaxID=1909734 RepID=UPI00396D2D31